MSERPPVRDWATDFDHTDPRWIEDPYSVMAELRGRCPMPTSERYGGLYAPMRYADIRAIAYDTDHFSSKRVVIRENPPNVPLPSPPITSDPPHHKPSRMLLLPAFTPQAVDRLIPDTRRICDELLDAIEGRALADAAADYAQHIPVKVIARMLGVPETEGDRFRKWIHVFIEDTIVDDGTSADRLVATAREMDEFFGHHAELRRREPGDDLISFVLKARHNGAPLTDRHFYGTLRLLLIAGIDTTWSAISASLLHLATHSEDRDRLAADPSLLPTAVEELLRAYAPVTMARRVTTDTEIGGCPMHAGSWVLLSFPAANRDPDVFPEPDKVLIDREDNRHAAFGIGIHRCIGSNLARMEMTVALEQWMRRIPRFRLADGAEIEWSKGPVRGPRTVPVSLG
ncbi:MAG: cytochrome P450 [Hyphomicrobiaceae bacterium]|nr:cytochrome P450 [Hyphomicrobiaceae bacterium]